MRTHRGHARSSGAGRPTPLISANRDDGVVVEMVYDRRERATRFCVWEDGQFRFEDRLALDGREFVPYSPHNNLVSHEIVLFPSNPEDYGTEEALVGEIRAFIHRFVDVSPRFEAIASYYVLLSWVYDAFNELPYLRLRGDPGSGKTRFLLTIGSLCYKPIFASGASTVSPIFRMLDAFRGTLVIDEGDFRMSDEKAEIVKILNNGNGRGFPVLRSEVSARGEVNPTAYAVFGPKLVATRGPFEDAALESRCLTEEMGQHDLRADVPINLPAGWKDAAETLRNKLLLFRFRSLNSQFADEAMVDPRIEPRLNQVFVPLLSVISDPRVRNEVHALAREFQRELVADRSAETESLVLELICDLRRGGSASITIGELTRIFAARYQDDFARRITPKWIGAIVRRKLRFRTYKSHGTFVIAEESLAKIENLLERYGLTSRVSPEHDVSLPAESPYGSASGE